MVRGTFWSTGQVIMSAVAGIDIALWDLKGKRLGVPVYELLGGPTRERVRVYRHLAGRPAEELVEDALALAEPGFTALRFGPLGAFDDRLTRLGPAGGRSSRRSRRTEALREALGDDVDLLLDAHTMFCPPRRPTSATRSSRTGSTSTRTRSGRSTRSSLRLVRDKVNLPIATGEQLAHKWEFQPLIENELVDYLRIDMVHAGGITEAKKILAMGEVHGQRSALHHASSPVNGGGVPARRHGGARTSASRSGWSSSRCTSSSRTRRAPRRATSCRRRAPGLGLEFDEAEARRRPSRDAALPPRSWPDGGVADY